MPATKPFSQACENNKLPILNIISQVFTRPTTVWEIGSGTGQHACFFARQLPYLTWQATDRIDNLPGIEAWIEAANLPNLLQPLALDIQDMPWPCDSIDTLLSANTLHIMSLVEVEILFERLKQYLNPDAKVCIYGPFNYRGQFTSDSNAGFDQWLKAQNPLSGIRDIEYIRELATVAGLTLLNDHAMPANNRLLMFQKST